MNAWQVEYAIKELQRRAVSDAATVEALTLRVATLEGIVLNVPADRLLGRHATTPGPAQAIRVGTGLELQDDVLANTGGGGGGGGGRAFSSGFSSGFS